MAEEGTTVRNIQWRSVFGFTHIFRTFRIAIHPSKLFLSLCLLLSIYIGGRILDAIWFRASRAVPNEIGIYDSLKPGDSFDQQRAAAWVAVEEAYRPEDSNYLASLEKTPDEAKIEKTAADNALNGRDMSAVRKYLIGYRDDKDIAAIDKQLTADLVEANKDTDLDTRKATIVKAHLNHDMAVDEKMAEYAARLGTVDNESGVGLFAMLFDYETNQVTGVVQSVLNGRWAANPADPADAGVVGHLYRFVTVGPLWLLRTHTLYGIFFTIIFLSSWSLFGGAVSRIAAVHVARDERISVRRATTFAAGKFLSFASAPVLPLALIVAIGLVVTVVCLAIGWIPYFGPMVVGIGFLPALLAGFFMTLIAIGTLGGFNLMYPTIAVEGSDSFDAISRSVTYVYGRPWKMLFYSAVAIAYGAATYIFVRFFITTMLGLTHHFVGMGLFGSDLHHRPVLNTMWPDPFNSGRLTYHIDWTLLNWGQAVGAVALSFWVYLVISILGAFALSFYFTASTIIYYLMRQDLDATEMDDVYLEQFEEEFNFPSATPAPAGVGTTVAVESTTVAVTPPAGDAAKPT